MKIERISENKIKCTLNREDLASRDIVLTEFAYGSEKARAFFRELMLIAEDEVGFEVEDIPLMIEAVPVNQDCIVLFVTKVSDPEELDTRFSRFTSSSDEYDEDEDEEEAEFSAEIEIEGNPENIDILGAVKDAVRNAVEGLSKAVESGNFNVSDEKFVPLNQSAKKLDTKTTKKPSQPQKLYNFIYSFRSLDDVCGVAHHLQGVYHGDNTLYKDMVEGTYYLVVGFHDTPAEVKSKVCDYLSEYGKKIPTSYALQAYYEEHYMCVIRSNALQTLGNL